MLKLGSTINILDNSGALSVKIINYRKKKTYTKSYVVFNNIVFGVIKEFTPNKKLKKKQLVDVLILGIKKKQSRYNGLYINFNKNFGVTVLKKKHVYEPIASRIYAPVLKEIKRKNIYKQVSIMCKQSI